MSLAKGKKKKKEDKTVILCIFALFAAIIVLSVVLISSSSRAKHIKAEKIEKKEALVSSEPDWDKIQDFFENEEERLIISGTFPVPRETILFIKEGDIYAIEASLASETNLTKNYKGAVEEFALCPCGQEIAFIGKESNGKADIYIADITGENIVYSTKISQEEAEFRAEVGLSKPEMEYKYLAWKNCAMIFFSAQLHPYVTAIWFLETGTGVVGMLVPREQEYNEKWVKDANNKGPRLFRNCSNPGFSSNQEELAYISTDYYGFGATINPSKGTGKIVVRNIVEQLTEQREEVFDGINAVNLSSQSWFNSRIVFSGNIQYRQEKEKKNIIGVLDTKAKKGWLQRQFSSFDVVWQSFGNNPAWSKCGKWIVFDYQGFIFILETETGNIRRIIEGEKPLWLIND